MTSQRSQATYEQIATESYLRALSGSCPIELKLSATVARLAGRPQAATVKVGGGFKAVYQNHSTIRSTVHCG